jgi:hypothetical protein
VLLFSLCGYRLVISLLQQKAEVAMAARIDRGFKDEDLVSLKAPALLPYYTNSKDFQYISGEVELDGVIYQYVKWRIYNDTIEYLCLQNQAKTRLVNAREQFFQLACNLQLNNTKNEKQTSEVKPLMLEYCPTEKFLFAQASAPSVKHLSLFYLHPCSALPLSAPAQPPERI